MKTNFCQDIKTEVYLVSVLMEHFLDGFGKLNQKKIILFGYTRYVCINVLILQYCQVNVPLRHLAVILNEKTLLMSLKSI